MRTMLVVLTLALVISGCEGNSPPPSDPSQTVPATGTTAATAATPGDPAGIAPANNAGATSLSGAPASPAEGKCKTGEAPAGATDLTLCLAACDKQDDTVPPGSRCIPARTSCKAQCNQKLKK